MPSQTILFDLEGTLVQVRVDESKVVEFLIGQLKARSPGGGMTLQRGYGLAETLRQAEGKVESSALEEIKDSVSSKLAEAEKTSAASATERRDASKAISSLQDRGVTVWAITGLSEQGANEVLRHLNLEGAVSIAATRNDSVDQKERIVVALKKTSSKPEAAILVADSPRDVEAARSAGIKCFAVYSQEVPVNRVLESKPDAFLYTIAELEDTLAFFEMKSQPQQVKPPSEPGEPQTTTPRGETQNSEPGEETSGGP